MGEFFEKVIEIMEGGGTDAEKRAKIVKLFEESEEHKKQADAHVTDRCVEELRKEVR